MRLPSSNLPRLHEEPAYTPSSQVHSKFRPLPGGEISWRDRLTTFPDSVYCRHMPPIPTAIPDRTKIRALTWERGYSISGLARKIGRPPATLWAITGGKPRPTGVPLLRQIAHGLSVRVSDISDWDGDDDTESDAETKIPAKTQKTA